MPGLLKAVAVKAGQEVKAGEELLRRRGDEDGEHPARRARRHHRQASRRRPATASPSTSASWSSAEARRIVRSRDADPRTPGPEAVAGARRLVLARPRHQCRARRPRPRRPLRHAAGGARTRCFAPAHGRPWSSWPGPWSRPSSARAARALAARGEEVRPEPDADWLRERRNALVHVGPDRAANDVPTKRPSRRWRKAPCGLLSRRCSPRPGDDGE